MQATSRDGFRSIRMRAIVSVNPRTAFTTVPSGAVIESGSA
jgi:hypothetical protein